MPRLEKMEQVAKRGVRGVADHGQFLVPGTANEYTPIWIKEQVKQLHEFKAHARWVAAFWGRALSQLAAQGHNKNETLSFSDILVEFLNMNRLAVEANNHVSWEYDRELWAKVTDRIR